MNTDDLYAKQIYGKSNYFYLYCYNLVFFLCHNNRIISNIQQNFV